MKDIERTGLALDLGPEEGRPCGHVADLFVRKGSTLLIMLSIAIDFTQVRVGPGRIEACT